MDLLVLAQVMSHAVGAVTLDENSVSVLAMLAGIIGGFTVTSLRPKAKKIEVERKDDSTPRNPD
jgi:hypothetical protein